MDAAVPASGPASGAGCELLGSSGEEHVEGSEDEGTAGGHEGDLRLAGCGNLDGHVDVWRWLEM